MAERSLHRALSLEKMRFLMAIAVHALLTGAFLGLIAVGVWGIWSGHWVVTIGCVVAIGYWMGRATKELDRDDIGI